MRKKKNKSFLNLRKVLFKKGLRQVLVLSRQVHQEYICGDSDSDCWVVNPCKDLWCFTMEGKGSLNRMTIFPFLSASVSLWHGERWIKGTDLVQSKKITGYLYKICHIALNRVHQVVLWLLDKNAKAAISKIWLQTKWLPKYLCKLIINVVS